MGVKAIRIETDKPAGTIYTNGDVVSGVCDIEMLPENDATSANYSNESPITVKIKMQGFVVVRWNSEEKKPNLEKPPIPSNDKASAASSQQQPSQTSDYFAARRLLQQLQTVKFPVPSRQQDGNTKVIYKVPFTFTLPAKGLKTSFRGKCGFVFYMIEAELDIPNSSVAAAAVSNSSSNKLVVRRGIRIVERLAIDTPNISKPVGENPVKKFFNSLVQIKNPPSVEAECNRSGYYSEDVVAVTAKFSNNSTEKLKPYVKLVMRTKYIGYSNPTAQKGGLGRTFLREFNLEAEHAVEQVFHDELEPGAKVAWNGVRFKLPKLQIPSTDIGIFKAFYAIQVGLANSEGEGKFIVEIPIVIAIDPSTVTPYVAEINRNDASVPPGYFVNAPPSYEDAMAGRAPVMLSVGAFDDGDREIEPEKSSDDDDADVPNNEEADPSNLSES